MGSHILQALTMRHFLLLTLVIVAVSADSAQETNPRFFGGIFGDLFGNNNQCSNCRHNLEEASYCCRNAIDSYCCQFSNNLINGGGFDPGYNPGGSSIYKPGSCPSNYYGRRRRSPEDAPGSRFFTPSSSSYKPNYNNNGGFNGGYNNNGGFNGGYNNNGGFNNGYNNNGACSSDRDCR